MLSNTLWRIIRIGVVGLVLVAVTAGLVFSDDWLWVAVHWSPPIFMDFYAPDGFDLLTTFALVVAGVLKAALLWLILRTPQPGPLDRRGKALRLLLYVAVADALVLWFPVSLLPDEVYLSFQLALWTAIDVLYLLVIRWRSTALRAATGAIFAAELAAMANDLLDELDLLELHLSAPIQIALVVSGAAGILLTVTGQRRDGRWSPGTLIAGYLALAVYTLVIPLRYFDAASENLVILVLWDALALIHTVWLAATAREMPVDDRGATPSPPLRPAVRAAVASVALLPVIVVIHPEHTPHFTYSGWESDCYDRPSFGDLKPAERDATFLCVARSVDDGFAPLFPETTSDQEILAYGQSLCRAEDREEQASILKRAGSERPSWGVDPEDLVYVCPEIIGATHPDLLRSTEQAKTADAAYIAELNGRCRDPWPRTRGVVQATANYSLFADGDYGYFVYDPDDSGDSAERATDTIYDDDTQIGVHGSAVLVGHLEDVIDLCLTVKAFHAAPPKRLAGWDQVTEVPVISRTGRLTIPERGEYGDAGADAPMPNLAIAGKGRYRVRVYVRLTEADEEHLVVVFPGASRKHLKLKQ